MNVYQENWSPAQKVLLNAGRYYNNIVQVSGPFNDISNQSPNFINPQPKQQQNSNLTVTLPVCSIFHSISPFLLISLD